MSIQNWVYPLYKKDDPKLGSPYKETMIQGTVEPGSPVLAPLSGEILKINYNDWDEFSQPLEKANIGSLFSVEILTMIQGIRVVNVIGPILLQRGPDAPPQPEVGETVYRGEELGMVPDISGTSNLTWTVFLNDRKGSRWANPLTVAKNFGIIQHYDDDDLLPEFDKPLPPPSRGKAMTGMGKLVVLGAALLLLQKWMKK